MRKLSLPLSILLLALVLGTGSPASATTMVLATDEQLTDQAPVVLLGTVTAAGPSKTLTHRPATEFEVQVERVLKGRVAADLVVVRVPGGVRPDGMALKIWGSPELAVSDRALLFLVPRQDGSYGVLHLAMGSFREMRHAGKSLAVRDLSEVGLANQSGAVEEGEVEVGRDFDAFSNWVADRALGKVRQPDYQVAATAEGIQSVREKFTYLQNVRRRWFEFDSNINVGWRAHEGGQPGLASGGFPEFQQAINVWNADPATNIRYRYDGLTNLTAGFTTFDRANVILFEDPNSEADGVFACIAPGNGSGVLAIGGPWFVQGQPEPVPIAGADIVVNNGAGCWFVTGARAAQVYAHELGHTLGLGHSCGDGNSGSCNTPDKENALMRATAHADNRGAVLGNDDRAGILTLYASGNQGGGNKPAAPSLLAATPLSGTQIRLNWTDNASNETNFRVEVKTGAGAFQEVQTVGVNATTATVTGLNPGTSYTFRVRARNGAGFSAYSNEVTASTQGQSLPAAPVQLVAEPLPAAPTQIRLTWQDRSSNETDFVVEASSATGGFTQVGTAAANSTTLTVSGLTAETPYTFRVRARNATGASPFSNLASATTAGAGGACVAGANTLCLAGGRVKVRVHWRTAQGATGLGGAVPSSSQTGLFWFFDAANVELIVKVLDGRGLNGFFWTFYGGLSDVQYWITSTDTVTGESATYHNPQGNFCGGADVRSLPASSITDAVRTPEPAGLTPVFENVCAPGTLCLLGGRFQVEVTWQNGGNNGVGTPAALSDQSGTFWFFDAANTELVVKVIDGRPLNGKFWFFYGALSDVVYQIRVTDTTTGTVKTYNNAQGNLCGQADINAF